MTKEEVNALPDDLKELMSDAESAFVFIYSVIGELNEDKHAKAARAKAVEMERKFMLFFDPQGLAERENPSDD